MPLPRPAGSVQRVNMSKSVWASGCSAKTSDEWYIWLLQGPGVVSGRVCQFLSGWRAQSYLAVRDVHPVRPINEYANVASLRVLRVFD